MPDTSTDPCKLPWIACYVDAMDWVDACSAAAEAWLDWQLAARQQLVDSQAEYLRAWSELSGWPMFQTLAVRGGEQLA